MGAKKYSAGAIFLQVVPVFANVQNQIEREAKKIDRALGDSMEKSGQKAGERAGKAMGDEINKSGKKAADDYAGHFETSIKGFVRNAQKEIDRLDLSTASEKMLKDLDQAKKKLRELNDQDFNVDFNSKQVIADLALVKSAVDGLTKGDHDLNIDSNIRKVVSEIDGALKFVDAAVDKRRVIEIKTDIDTKPIERKMGAFEKSIKKTMEKASAHIDGSVNKDLQRLKDELDYLSKLRVGIDIGANQLHREVREIMTELDRLSKKSPTVDVKVDAGRAWSELAAFDVALKRLDGKTVKVNTKATERGLLGLVAGGDNAANSFRSFNLVLFATSTLGPALIPTLGALAAGLFALGPAAAVAAASIGAVLIGFSGIGDALTALQAQEDQGAKTAQQAGKTAADGARAQQDAARRVVDARRAAARAVKSALESQADAQRAYRDSIEDVQDAERALAEARKNARGTGADIKERMSDNKLAQDQGLLDVFNATVNYNSVMADGSATNAEQEQARIQMEQAKDALSDLRREAKELAAEKKKWDREGVNGTDEVKSAQDNLNSALEAQRDAYRDLGDAARAVDEARADGARSVADAMRAQEQAGRSAAEAMAAVNTQQANVDAAMNKLGPAGQKFARFIQGMKKEFYGFRDDIQTVMLPQIQSAILSFFGSDSGKVLREALIGLADSFGRFVVALSASFQGEAWLGFFRTLRDLGPGIQDAFGAAFISFLEAMASIMTVVAPYTEMMAKGFANLMERFANWAASKKGQDQIQKFMDWIVKITPDVIHFVGSLAKAAAALIVALAPWGDVVLKALDGLLDIIAGMDPKTLALLATGILIVVAASQHAYAAMNAINSGIALLTNPIGLIVLAIIGIALALVYLYKNNEEFRDFVNKAWKAISAAFVDAWDIIKPQLMDLWDALQSLWKDALVPFLKAIGPVLVWLIKKLIPLVARVLAFWINNMAFLIKYVLVPSVRLIGKAFKWVWEKVLKPTWKYMQIGAKWLWEKALKPVWDDMKDAWHDMMTGMEWAWEHVLKPAWDYIRKNALPALKRAFRNTVDSIGGIWSGLQAMFATPIDFLLDGVINNGIIDGYNTVAGWVHAKKFDHIEIPKYIQKHSAFATGGILPGYTPGRDVHSFVSPTAGRLDLSGGEAIMRPEWTAAMGTGYVNQMNALARQGGTEAIRRAMYGQQFARGGIFFPLPGARMGTYPGHDGVDLNVGSGSADLGMTFYSATSGRVSSTGYGRGYGNAVFVRSPFGELVYGHSLDGSIRVHPGQAVAPGTPLARVGNTGNSTAPHLHFGFPGGSYEAALGLLTGIPIGDPGQRGTLGSQIQGEKKHRAIPKWLMSVIKDPLGAVKNWITEPIKNASKSITDSRFFDVASKVPLMLAKKTADKVWDIVPGWAKTAAGWAGDGAEWVVGGVKNAGKAAGDALGSVGGAVSDGAGAVGDFLGYANGGILPYNGTMKYDSGGYLPPGLTSVVNLTGKPEPVFTNDQWSNMEGRGAAGTIHYEPHFEGSDLTAADVAGDLNFTFRKIRRGGKYAGVGD